MRAPPAQSNTGGAADERLPARRPAAEPAGGGEALVEHLVGRLAQAEESLREARERADLAESARAVLGRLAARIHEEPATPLAELVRLALPALGDFCVIEEAVAEGVSRTVVASERHREAAAAALAGPLPTGASATLAMDRVRSGGRVERLEMLPELPHGNEDVVRALDALGDGPAMLVPVESLGRLCAALAFGRVSAGQDAYDGRAQAMAADVGRLLALGIERRRALVELEEAARTKAEFLTMMSHELRTPLNAIGGYAQLLEMGFRGPLTGDQMEAVSRIIKGQEHLLELVDAVLTFSRLTSGRLQIERVALSAESLLQIASDPVRRDFEARGITLQVASCATNAHVLADHERAPQVLRHLLSNACKFTAPGGQVSIACTCSTRDVCFTVTDSGCGIPAAQQEAIFHPFVQVDAGHTRSADGSGLGLSIARELARRMGGALEVASEVGVGSRFTFTLPRADLPAGPSAPRALD